MLSSCCALLQRLKDHVLAACRVDRDQDALGPVILDERRGLLMVDRQTLADDLFTVVVTLDDGTAALEKKLNKLFGL